MVSEAGLRIAFFGSPQFAVPTLEALLASRHTVALVVTQPDRPRGRGQHVSEGPVKALAAASRIPVLQPNRLKDPDFLAEFARFAPDLGVVAAYGKILPEEVLRIPRLGLINVHASLLPRWRGAAPAQHAVMAGDPETGVTIMRVVKELDAGPTFAAVSRPIGEQETSEDVQRDLASLGARLLVQVVDAMEHDGPPETPQDDRLVTYAPRITKEEGLIDWNQPARAIHDKVRGLHPWPHAYTYLHEARYILLQTAVAGTDPPDAAPGTIVEASAERLRVAAGRGCLDLVRLQPEGRRAMSAREFLAGHRIRTGEVLGSNEG